MSLAEKPYLRRVEFRDSAAIDSAAYPFTIAAARHIDQLVFHPDVNFFVGENGSGKSTVLEALAMARGYSQEGGTRNVRLETADTVSWLHRSLKLIKSWKKPADGYFLRAETFFNVATYMEELGYVAQYGSAPHRRSRGEAFMAVLQHKLRGRGLYLLDEPEAALSPSRQLAALRAIHDLVQDGSQFVIATHSPILLAYPQARIYRFDGNRVMPVEYAHTEHFTVTRAFLKYVPRYLREILQDAEPSSSSSC